MLINALFIVACILAVVACFGALAHLWVQVPYVPTPDAVIHKAIDLAEIGSHHVVYDLGAGDGRVLVAAKRRYPDIKAIGIEFIPTVWLWSRVRTWWLGVDVCLKWGDALHCNVHDADVVFVYLFPHVMEKLEKKFDQELKPGTRVVSHAFPFVSREPIGSDVVVVGKRERKLFVYQW